MKNFYAYMTSDRTKQASPKLYATKRNAGLVCVWRYATVLLIIALVTACGGGSSEKKTSSDNNAQTISQNTVVPELQANNYSTETTAGDAVRIYALDNDIGVHDPSLVVSIVSSPKGGTVDIQPDNSILYTPDSGYTGTDTFDYQITLASGATDRATVSVAVTADGPLCAYTAGLAWDTPSDPEITGYYIYYGTSSSTYTDKTYVGLVFSHDYCLSSSGTHYFAASSLNIYGRESSLSEEIVVTIP